MNRCFTRLALQIIFAILMTFTACVKFSGADAVVLYYHLSNHSDYPIRVKAYDFWSHKNYTSNTSDSTFYFNAGEDKDLLIVYNNSFINSEDENKDTLQGIHVLYIFKNDTIPATKNYLLRKYWTYSQPDKYKHVYNLEITNSSFNP